MSWFFHRFFFLTVHNFSKKHCDFAKAVDHIKSFNTVERLKFTKTQENHFFFRHFQLHHMLQGIGKSGNSSIESVPMKPLHFFYCKKTERFC